MDATPLKFAKGAGPESSTRMLRLGCRELVQRSARGSNTCPPDVSMDSSEPVRMNQSPSDNYKLCQTRNASVVNERKEAEIGAYKLQPVYILALQEVDDVSVVHPLGRYHEMFFARRNA